MTEAEASTDVLPIVEACEVVGGQAVMARSLGVTPAAVNQWCKGLRAVPAERCPAIQRLTHGRITCKQLRPDVDWEGALVDGEPPGDAAPVVAEPVFDRRRSDRRAPAEDDQPAGLDA